MLDKYELLDKELAEDLGWHRIVRGNHYGDTSRFVGDHPFKNIVNGFIPRWTQDDGECFRLMVAHNVSVLYMITHVKVSAFGSEMIVYEDFKNHKDNQTCLRFAVVQAIITRLKET